MQLTNLDHMGLGQRNWLQDGACVFETFGHKGGSSFANPLARSGLLTRSTDQLRLVEFNLDSFSLGRALPLGRSGPAVVDAFPSFLGIGSLGETLRLHRLIALISTPGRLGALTSDTTPPLTLGRLWLDIVALPLLATARFTAAGAIITRTIITRLATTGLPVTRLAPRGLTATSGGAALAI
jgi:hypothetical protein